MPPITQENIIFELNYVDMNQEHSLKCSQEMKQLLAVNGFIYYVDGCLMLTNLGELKVGYPEEDIGVTEEDIAEGFFYKDEEYDNEQI